MPRLGMGIPIIGGAAEAAVLAVEDFVFLNDVSGELTPVDTSSRTNFLTYSEDFSQSVWTKQSGITPTYNTTETLSPVGTNNATKFIGNGSSGVLKASLNVSSVVTRSVHLKSVTGTVNVILKDPNNTITSKSLTVTTEWQRFDLTEDNTTSLQGIWIDDIPVSGVYMWGAQVEQDSRVSNYIPTSGSAVSVATTELGDLSNVWDFDNTDIMLEVDPENEGAFEEATANLITNHDFAVDANWTKGTGWSISGGKAVSAGDSTHSLLTQTISLPAGQYEVSLNAIVTSGSFSIQAQGSGTDTGAVINSSGAHREIFTITKNRSTFSIRSNDGNGVGSIDNVFVKEYAITPLNV